MNQQELKNIWSLSLKEAFVEECELIRLDSLQNDLDIQGEYVSEEYMRGELQWSENLVL